MIEQEVKESLLSNLSFSDIFAFLSMIGAIIAAAIAWLSKIKAAKSKASAEEYAKNADEANKAAKGYYDEMLKHLYKSNERDTLEEIKKKILVAIGSGKLYSLWKVAEIAGISVEQTEEIICELRSVDGYTINTSNMDKELKEQIRILVK